MIDGAGNSKTSSMSSKDPDGNYLFPPMPTTWSPPFDVNVVMLAVSENVRHRYNMYSRRAGSIENVVSERTTCR